MKRILEPAARADSGNRLYSIPAASEYLGGVSEWTIRAWLRDGVLRRTKVGKRTLIRESELNRMIRDEGGTQ